MVRMGWIRGLASAGLISVGCGPTIETPGGDGSAGSTSSPTDSTGTLETTAPGTLTTFPGTVTTTPPDDTETTGLPHDLPPFECDNPAFACNGPLDCDAWACGTPGSQVDETGCLRRSCTTDEDCLGTDVCHRPLDWGQCASSGTSCHDGPTGECECVSDPDCGGAWCLPADEAPPSEACEDTSPAACEASGCTSELGRPIVPVDASCLCDLETPHCIWLWEGAELQPGNTAYMRYEDQSVVVFPWSAQPPPLGWIACDDVAFPPPGCICAQNLPCAMG
jgi:hypothetical protein